MNYFAFTGLVNGLIATFCGIIVYIQDSKNWSNRLYALFFLSVSEWSYFYCAWQMAENPQTALLYARCFMIGAIFNPVLFYHSALAIFGLITKTRIKILVTLYALTVMFTLADLTDLMVKSVGPKMFFPFWPKPGLLFHPYIVMFLLIAIGTIRLIFAQRKHASPEVRGEISWVVAAMIIAWMSGASNFFLWYGIKIPPYANVLASLSATTTILFYFKLGYLGVKKMIKQISILLVIYTTLLAIVLPAAIPLAGRFLRNPAMNPMGTLIGFGIVMGLVLSAGPFIYVYFIRRQYWLKSHLSVGLTHELKSPLGVIQSALDMISTELASPHVNMEKTADYFRIIRRHVTRLDHNVKDLLNIAKIQEGRLELKKGSINFSQIINDAINSFKDRLTQKNLHLHSSFENGIMIHADEEKISQVVGNILSNAIKFTNQGSININLSTQDSKVVFSIRDEGKGIPKNELNRIFERFYQGKNSGKGSGLGLAIAKAWVEAHGGKIWAESEGEGKGTKISFTLPRLDS